MYSKISPDLHINISDENLLRLGLLTRKVGLKYAKQIIFTHFPKDPIPLHNALVPHQRNLRNLFPDQRQILFGTPSSGTNIDSCDLSLLGKILRLKNDPSSNTIEDLLKSRNWIAHYGSKTLTDPLYTQKFNDIKAILKRLGANDAEIEHFRHARIDNSKEIIVDLLKDIRNEIPRSIVLRETLDIVCKDIEDGWRDLAISLLIDVHVVNGIAEENITNEEKMNKCFEYKSFNISWNHLKQHLLMQNHHDIVKKIIKDTYITTGLKEYSFLQKNHYQSSLEKVQRTDPLSNWPLPSITREEEYVALYLSNDIGKTDPMVNSDHVFNLTNQFRLRMKIEMKDIFKEDSDDFVLIRGVGGVGKSTLADMFVLKWSKDELLNDIKLVFHIKCREIEEICQDTLKDFLISYFTPLSAGFNFHEIEEIGRHVLLVFDGLDELESSKVTKMYHMLNDNCKLQSTNFRVCLTGRPKSLQNLRANVSGAKTMIDVMGFTAESQARFIERYYKDHENCDGKVARMVQNIKDNTELKSLATIPLYLQILCYLNDQENGFDYVTSTVSLYLVMCLFIIQRCYKELGLAKLDLYAVARNERVVQILLKLGKLSYNSCKSVEIINSEKEMFDLEKTGFIIKYGTKKGFSYQFQHLIFSEFLCGLYLFAKGIRIVGIVKKCKSESPLLNCLPSLITLHTLCTMTKSSLENEFLHNVIRLKNPKILNACNMESLLVKLFDIQNFTPKVNFKTKKPKPYDVTIDDSWLLLLQCIYESKVTAPSVIVNAVSKARFINVEIRYQHQLHYLTRFFESVTNRIINKLTIDLIDDNLTEIELSRLEHLLVRCEGIMVTTHFNIELLLSSLIDPVNRRFYNLKYLMVLSAPVECNLLMRCVPYLTDFALNCEHLSVESAQFLSRCLRSSKFRRECLLQTLFLYRCPDQLIRHFLPCMSCIPSLALFDCHLSISTLDMLSKSVQKVAADSNFKCLGLQFCHINDDGVQVLSSCFGSITELCLEDNPDISDVGIQTIADSILQQVKANGMATLQVLHLSHLNTNFINMLLPAVPHLSHLDLLKSEIGIDDVYDLKMAAQPQRNDFSMKIAFNGNVNTNKAVIKDLFSSGPVDVNYKNSLY